MERLRLKVADVESTILADWDSDRRSESDLRARLSDIATDVTQLSHALDGQSSSDDGESLYDKVTKFSAPEDTGVAAARVEPGPPAPVSDRLAALRELQETR
jgi:hypothetical protein